MTFFRLVLKNTLRNKLRLSLTVAGIAVVVAAFGLLQTTVRAWYAGVDATAQNRLVTRHTASLSIHLPVSYQYQLAVMPGVTGVTYAVWFGGAYRDAKGFFPKYAVEPVSYLDIYPEYRLTPKEQEAFIADRRGCIIGRKLAIQYGWQIGDTIPIKGTIYPGDWEFIVRGIYSGAEGATDETLLLFHWDYLNERRKVFDPDRAGGVGWYVVRVADPGQASAVALAIDLSFANSAAETRSETEQAYRMGFVAMSGTLIQGLKLMAIVLNGITLLVLATALVMAVRERTREYALLKTLGFRPRQVAGLIVGEALLIAGLGAGLGVALTIPFSRVFAGLLARQLGNFFRVFDLRASTLLMAVAVALAAGLAAAVVPALRVVRLRITEGFRHVG